MNASKHGLRSAEIAKRLAAAASVWRRGPTDENTETLRTISLEWDDAQRLRQIEMQRHLRVK
jgi:hypothetical protein